MASSFGPFSRPVRFAGARARGVTLTRLFGLAAIAVLVARAESARADDAPLEPEVRGIVTLGQAVDAALKRNPELAATSVDVGIRDALVLQAGLRPNPTVGVESEDVAGSGGRGAADTGQTTLTFSQPFELGGKRNKRRRAAELERDVVSWEVVVRRRALVADVQKAFAATLVAQERLTLIDNLLRIAEASVRSVGATVEAGAVSPVEKTRAEVSVSRARTSRLAAERELVAARSVLAASWGSPTANFERVAGRLEPIAKPSALQDLLPRVQTIPDLARVESELAQRHAALALERSQRIPDVTLQAGVRHYADPSDGALVLGFSVPLPLFDTNQGNILAASRAVTKARLEQNAAAITAETRARQAHAAMVAAFAQATALREQTIPQAERAYEGAKDAYTRGLFRYLEVLDAQRTLFELRAEHLAVLAIYYEAAAELSRWVDDPQEQTMQNVDGGQHD